MPVRCEQRTWQKLGGRLIARWIDAEAQVEKGPDKNRKLEDSFSGIRQYEAKDTIPYEVRCAGRNQPGDPCYTCGEERQGAAQERRLSR